MGMHVPDLKSLLTRTSGCMSQSVVGVFFLMEATILMIVDFFSCLFPISVSSCDLSFLFLDTSLSFSWYIWVSPVVDATIVEFEVICDFVQIHSLNSIRFSGCI